MATSVLDMMEANHLTVLRTWAFNDGTKDSYRKPIQPRMGEYSEEGLACLDWLVAEASNRNLRLILTLLNYWEDYGGMAQYASWASTPSIPVETKEFYTNEICQNAFKAYISMLLTRVNTITGRAYKDEPAILAWSVCNEPRCPADSEIAAGTVAAWIDGIAAHIKSIDSNHLVTVDTEGFFGPARPEASANPPSSRHDGCDFESEIASPHIDFACMHAWVDHWQPNLSLQEWISWTIEWIKVHNRVCKRVHKPLILSEFGVPRDRAEFNAAIYKHIEKSILRETNLAGTCYWQISAAAYKHGDASTITLENVSGNPPLKYDLPIARSLVEHANWIRGVDGARNKGRRPASVLGRVAKYCASWTGYGSPVEAEAN
ncbi:hypothetical protein H632_c59p2 [Helicosporidium sp. ATCC 50920]|nr:hypothetical protein H632_c59p2 [Helicosporidium sp. ATCC 50920]|eukprot:KDD76944.1 hypothetical protein H632_c59p2 [Helicosporidium sp. ATCC 50920]